MQHCGRLVNRLATSKRKSSIATSPIFTLTPITEEEVLCNAAEDQADLHEAACIHAVFLTNCMHAYASFVPTRLTCSAMFASSLTLGADPFTPPHVLLNASCQPTSALGSHVAPVPVPQLQQD